jgi:sigma-B regulation protein RsbU (phosphoserine phosphatase)
MFVTIWIGILDTDTGIISASSAGHEYPFYTDLDGEYQMLQDPHGVVCGVMENLEYEDYTFKLPVGGRLFVYTDGVAEAQNGNEEMFGLNRIRDSLNSHRDKSPSELITLVKEDVDRHADGQEQFDDITMLSLWYKGR